MFNNKLIIVSTATVNNGVQNLTADESDVNFHGFQQIVWTKAHGKIDLLILNRMKRPFLKG